MDSNESTEDKISETSTKMEISESSLQEDSKNEKQLENIDSEKIEIKENHKSENVVNTNEKIDKKADKNETEESQSKDSVKINTSENDSKVIKVEEIKDEKEKEKPVDIVSPKKDVEETPKVDTSTRPETPAPNKDVKEIKRKRKIPNTPPVTNSPVQVEQNGSASKRKKMDSESDKFCWRCHKESVDTQCSVCPRSWHRRCMGGAPPLSATNWICSECSSVQQAENAETRSQAMCQLTIEQLCMMLKHVVERMRDQTGSEPFLRAVDLEEVPNYLEYVVKPMDLSLLESNIRAKMYASTESFMADAKWIQHNCIVFNTCGGVYTDTSKLTNTAKQMLKVARQEVSEIEACPDCFAHGRNLPRPLPSWFIEPCRRPHPIVWAKLKGFPFWPAKALPRLNAQGLVDVRFFGEHDRAWVSPKDIYLYSHEPPVALPKKKKLEMEECVSEVEEHSKKLEAVFGKFRYAPTKTPYDPHDLMQIKMLLPEYDPTTNTRISSPKVQISTPVSKVVPPKVEKQTPNTKSATAASTNGVLETPPVEKRKLFRKKKLSESPQKSVNSESPEIETVAIITKGENKFPPEKPSTINSNKINNETLKRKSSPEISAIIEVNSNSHSNKIIPVKKIKSDSVKKIKLTKVLDKEEIKKTTLSAKSSNGKPITVLHALPKFGLQNNSDGSVKTPGHKPKTIYITNQKRSSLVPVNSKLHTKALHKIHSENKIVGKTLNKTLGKEISKFVPNSVLKGNDLVSNKPMTAIPMSAKKDQTKAMYMVMNSNASESAKHFSDKDSRVNNDITIIKQEPKEEIQQPKLTIARKPGKARKSFPNKPPSFPQIVTPASSSYPLSKGAAGAGDAMVYIPAQSTNLNSVSYQLAPPDAGPVTAKIHECSKDLANRVAQLITDTIKEVAESNGVDGANPVNHEATIHFLKLRMERMQWEHQQEISELKHNHELVLREVKAGMELERHRAVQETLRQAEIDKKHCIEDTKRKQWCVVCGNEAMFYCCWNTAYCDYPCQQKHWPVHISTCAQKAQSQQQQQQQQKNGSPSPSQPLLASSKSQQQPVMPKLVINNQQQTSPVKKA